MILYPTETIYGLGVNALDDEALATLFTLKGRDESKTVSWGVRDLADIDRYAVVSETAQRLAETYLPGPLTLVLPAKDTVPATRQADDGTVGFRLPSDVVAQRVIAEFMDEFDAPLTCTSANVSGQPNCPSPAAILAQFTEHGKDVGLIRDIFDDGPRQGDASTVVRVTGDQVEVLRQGVITIDPALLS